MDAHSLLVLIRALFYRICNKIVVSGVWPFSSITVTNSATLSVRSAVLYILPFYAATDTVGTAMSLILNVFGNWLFFVATATGAFEQVFHLPVHLDRS